MTATRLSRFDLGGAQEIAEALGDSLDPDEVEAVGAGGGLVRDPDQGRVVARAGEEIGVARARHAHSDGILVPGTCQARSWHLAFRVVGAEVTELIQGYAVARQLETTEAELMHTVFPHPTLSEMMHESVLDAYGRAVHM